MARAIISCTEERFDIGDKVKTADGTVIRIVGAAIGQKFYNAELCTKVHPSTPTTAEVKAKLLADANVDAAKHGEDPIKPVSGGAAAEESDCIVWGG